jgi:hypothetical protein
MSQLISIDLARAGMCLGEDLRGAKGMVLAPRGAPIGDALLALARAQGITELRVEVQAAPAKVDPEARKRRLEHLFRHAGNEALTQALFRTLLEYREERPK